ncbi:isoleucine--trna ligase [Quercus suber]|uniref:Isoleucine--trna ligase n=1 Tax=Quercus suber TaxID=58331 RepID=A0AAW0M501_QUESU
MALQFIFNLPLLPVPAVTKQDSKVKTHFTTYSSTFSTFSFPNHEEEILRLWTEIKAFETQLGRTKDTPEYVFYDGLPFATGFPHYGHILAGTIKDIVTWYQSMNGFHVTRRFGWDCHGLLVENEIDRRLNLKKRDDVLKLGILEPRNVCKKL